MRRRSCRALVGAVMVATLWSAGAHAGSCSALGAWDPDPAATNSSTCGPGNDKISDPTEILNGLTFVRWDKDDAPGLNELGFFYTGSQSGFWFWNATNSLAAGNDLFALVLKDGANPNDPIRWAWFILDNPAGAPGAAAVNWLATPITAGGCESGAGSFAFTHCGTWSMYGDGNSVKAVSHMSIYGVDGPDTRVPAPATLVLLGAGLFALRLVRGRHRRTSVR